MPGRKRYRGALKKTKFRAIYERSKSFYRGKFHGKGALKRAKAAAAATTNMIYNRYKAKHRKRG